MTRAEEKLFEDLNKIGIIPSDNSDGYHEDRPSIWIDFEVPENAVHADYWDNYWGSEELSNVLDYHRFYFEWVNPGFANVYPV